MLLPFLHKAYTIDDPVFLREAQNVLTDPLHPSAFPLVWSSDRRLRASEFLPGGPVAAYVLVPLALARWREWAGHLLVFVYFAIAIVATVALARRLGLSPWAQQAAGLLTASAPAALGMAGTVMPDIAAMMFTVLGMERYIEWNRSRRWADRDLGGRLSRPGGAHPHQPARPARHRRIPWHAPVVAHRAARRAGGGVGAGGLPDHARP